MFKDFPKDTSWSLNKYHLKGNKESYDFEIWDTSQNHIPSIAYIRRSTPSAMAKAIKALVEKLKTKK